jgi:hypothetical protein
MSYRRDDTSGDAGRIADRLRRDLGDDTVFMDVDGVRLGVDFVKHLTQEVAGCDVLLAVIGQDWISVADESGARRLDNPHDFVRIEIGAALQRDIPVIPILINGAKVPRLDQLPEDLAPLAVRNGLEVRHPSFHTDLDRLVREFKPTTPVKAPIPPSRPKMLKLDRLRPSLDDVVLWILGSIGGACGAIFVVAFLKDMQGQGNTEWLYIVPGILIALAFVMMLVWSAPEKKIEWAPRAGVLAMVLSCALVYSAVAGGPNPGQKFFQNVCWVHPSLTILLTVVFSFMRKT